MNLFYVIFSLVICGKVVHGYKVYSARNYGQDTQYFEEQEKQVNFDRIDVEDTPDAFEIIKPVASNQKYNDFLSFLYRHDTAKDEQSNRYKRNIESTQLNMVARDKRALIFRPLFVYKQQELKRQKVQEIKKKVTKKPIKPIRTSPQG